MLNTRLRNAWREFLSSDETYATVLAAFVIDEFGAEAFNWDPSVLAAEIRELGLGVTPGNIEKIMAVGSLLTTDQFYRDPIAFNFIAEALTGDPVDRDIFDPVDLHQAAWAITESAFLDEGEDRPPWGDDVRAYLGVILRESGVFAAVPPFSGIAIMPPAVDVAGDPDISRAAMAANASAVADLADVINENTRELFLQLDRAPLKNRDEQGWSRIRDKVLSVVGSNNAQRWSMGNINAFELGVKAGALGQNALIGGAAGAGAGAIGGAIRGGFVGAIPGTAVGVLRSLGDNLTPEQRRRKFLQSLKYGIGIGAGVIGTTSALTGGLGGAMIGSTFD